MEESMLVREVIGKEKELVRKACTLAMEVHKFPGKPFLVEKIVGSSSKAIIGFSGSWSAKNGWFADNSFGETEINRELFPSLKAIGNDEAALVNKAFLQRFQDLLGLLKIEVCNLVRERKQIVFTGHSSGGAVAILATVWFLEEQRKSPETRHDDPPLCFTFGSPLVGNFIFSHALRREKWSSYFINFLTRFDIFPRILLAPFSSIEREFQLILNHFNPHPSSPYAPECIFTIPEASDLFEKVMRSASIVTSHNAGGQLMGSTNPLLDSLKSFVQISPYRPFGTYVFLGTETRKWIVLENNPDAVLQTLFYSCQLSRESEGLEVVYKSIKEHWVYHDLLTQQSKESQNVVCLNKLEELPLSENGAGENAALITALNELGLSTTARLSLRAAGVRDRQRKCNQDKIDKKKKEIEELLASIQEYRSQCKVHNVGYYDAFRLQKKKTDFQANVKRQQLVGIWDEIIEMLKRYELEDEFEGREDWIDLGTRFRHLLEPLDIANYYRHFKNDDTGPYLKTGRPKRYRYTQRWREHALRMQEASEESSFWAEVEELSTKTSSGGPFGEIKDRVLILEGKMKKWNEDNEIGNDVFWKGSTFMVWWNALPDHHKSESCIAGIMKE